MFDLLELFEGDEREQPPREQSGQRQPPRGRIRGWISRFSASFDEDEDDDRHGRARHRKRRERDFGWD